MGYNVDDYVDVCYSTTNYKKAYSGIIFPMNGHELWEKTGHTPLPPNIENQPGRPKKKRKQEAKDPVEVEADGIKILTKKTQLTVRCGNCQKSGHNRRTCSQKSDSISSSNQVQHMQVQLQVDEEMMQSVYNDAVMEAYIPDDDPPFTQPGEAPSQTVQTEITFAPVNRPNETPLNVVDAEMIEVIMEDTPLKIAAQKIKKMKAQRLQDTRKIVIKKEMQDHIEKSKNVSAVVKKTTKENGSQMKPQWNPCVKVTDQLNNYTGPMKLGKQIAPPVKQFKTIVGGTSIKSAPFLAHGKNVITSASLTKAVDKAATNAKLNARKEKESANKKGKNT